MKNYLHTLPYFLLFLVLAYIPPKSYAQCLCSGGDPATPLTYYYKLDTSNGASATISFPKFDPAVGILSCVRFNDTLSLVTISEVINMSPFAVTYRFLLNVTNNITGPGISISESATRNYGPTVLAGSGSGGDRTTYGPDTLFELDAHQTNTSSVASYLGSTGNVDFVYTVNGGLISQQGGIDYIHQISSKYWGGFRLTYYWCPNLVLATNIKNFSAYKKDRAVLLKWVTDNKTPGSSYEIEYSIDGNNFSGIGKADSKDIAGNTTQHEFQYAAGTTASGKIYFRIKQIDAQGKVSYSSIRIVDMNENSAAGFIVYPNPVERNISMQFDRSLNGNYVVEVTNLAGQVMHHRNIKLNNVNNVQFELTNPPPSGMYYLKLTDSKSKLSYSNKLIIRR